MMSTKPSELWKKLVFPTKTKTKSDKGEGDIVCPRIFLFEKGSL